MMLTSDLVLGIDGGGSKTRAILARVDGAILGRGAAAASNYQSVGVLAATAALDDAVRAAFEAAGMALSPVAAVCLGLAGAGRAEDYEVPSAWVAIRFPTARFRLANDAELVLAAGTTAGWGLAVIAGTGSIAYASDREGRTARAGGWGYLLGDEGSGYAIGLAALRAVVAAFDGRAPETRLRRAVLAHLRLADPRGLVQKAYQPPLTTVEIAALAELVNGEAMAGDAVAMEILAAAGRDLAATASAAIRRLGLSEEVPAALAGSVLVKGQLVREAFIQETNKSGLLLKPLALVEEPALGAVRLALAEAGWPRRS